MLLLNRYEYDPATDLLGKGNFSRVYRAVDESTGKPVAIKLYKTGLLYRPVITETVKKDLMSLDHPGVNKYISIEELEKEDAFGETEKIQVCVMETAEAGNISSYYKKHRNDQKLKKILSDVIKGLSYLHQQHIIHRHLRPSNILIYTNGNIPTGKISDYAITKDGETETEIANSLTGSIPYLSPEELDGRQYGIDGKISFNIDIWLLGLTVYETITGEPLFRNKTYESSEQVIKNILSDCLPDKIQTLSEPFRTLVSTCLVKDAKKRLQNIEELLNLINDTTASDTEIDDTGVITVAEMQEQNITNTSVLSDTPSSETDDTQVMQNIQPANDDTGQITIPENQQSNEDDTSVISHQPDENISTDHTEIIPEDIQSNHHRAKETSQHISNEPIKEGSIVLFNRYEYLPVADLIGRGGFSRVYKAYDKKLSRWVALKIYKTNDLSDRYSPFAEIKRVINLDNGNICRYLDIEEMENLNPFGELEKIQVCVMELMDSGNIAEYYKSHPDPKILKKLLADVLHGLAYLHKKGIIHRDIKPANILIKESIEGPVAKITDFGISKISDTVGNNSTSALIVSIPFMAPEQFNTKKYGINNKITFNLDLWSLGVTIYEIYTGDVLFKDNDGDNSEQIMANIIAPELPQKINRLPEPLKTIVARCLIKDAGQRAQKAEELIALLEKNKDTAFIPLPHEETTENIIRENVSANYSILPETEQGHNGKVLELSAETQKKPFSFEYDDEEKIKKETKPILNRRRILIIAGGIIMLLGYFLFIKNFMSKNTVTLNTGKSDSLTIRKKQLQSDTLINNSEQSFIQTGSNDSVQAFTHSKGYTANEEDKSLKENNTSAKSNSKQKPHKQTGKDEAKVKDKLSVEITTDQSCKLFLNGETYADLNAGYLLKTYMKPGTYTLKAISNEGNKSYGRIITVKQIDMGNTLQVKISF